MHTKLNLQVQVLPHALRSVSEWLGSTLETCRPFIGVVGSNPMRSAYVIYSKITAEGCEGGKDYQETNRNSKA